MKSHCADSQFSEETELLKKRVLEEQEVSSDTMSIQDVKSSRGTKRQREEQSDIGHARLRMKSVRWAPRQAIDETPRVLNVSQEPTNTVDHGNFDLMRHQTAADVAEFSILGILLGIELARSPGFDSSPASRLRLVTQLAERASPTLLHASTDIQGPGDGGAAFESHRPSFRALIEDILHPRMV